jgi:hypothetical protein
MRERHYRRLMVDNKAIIASGVTLVATLLLTALVGSFVGVFERGSDALSEDQIKKVLKDALVTDSGDTYGAALVNINNKLIVVETKLTAMERALEALSAE